MTGVKKRDTDTDRFQSSNMQYFDIMLSTKGQRYTRKKTATKQFSRGKKENDGIYYRKEIDRVTQPSKQSF